MVNTTFGFDEAKAVMGAIVDGSRPIIKAVMQPNGQSHACPGLNPGPTA